MNEYKKKSYRRAVAISTNIWHIERLAIKNNRPDLAKDEYFLHNAAVWSYRRYGFGVADYSGYIEFISRKDNCRLYNKNVKLWYKIIKHVFKRDNYTCAYCGSVGGKLECDHINPVSKGGTNDLKNLITSCRRCNRQKKDKTVIEFNLWRSLRK